MSEMRTIFAGFGGQGLLFAGKVMAYCGLIEDREVTWLPSYGPEMRGGTANCSVTLSDRRIGSPLVLNPDALLALNQPSYDKYLNDVQRQGIIVADSSMIPHMELRRDVKTSAIPAASLAEEHGIAGLANIIMLGKLWELTGFCKEETIEQAIRKCVPARKAEMIDFNLKALEIGRKA